MEQTLASALIGGATVLIGKIVWDWLTGKKRGGEDEAKHAADWFDIDFDPAPLPTVTVTKYIEVKRKWYDNAYLTLGAGVLAGVAISNIKE